ncbi:MAG: hypothetical protein JST42_22315 [Bacteroidetes bacterium]|nr:hypothetical protein [Bacteroidota bacterium]
MLTFILWLSKTFFIDSGECRDSCKVKILFLSRRKSLIKEYNSSLNTELESIAIKAPIFSNSVVAATGILANISNILGSYGCMQKMDASLQGMEPNKV